MDLEAIKAREKAASPGPWEARHKWSFDSDMTTQDEFGAMLSSAENCPDFKENK